MDSTALIYALALLSVPALIAFAVWAVARLPFLAVSVVSAPCARCAEWRAWTLGLLGWVFGLRSIVPPRRPQDDAPIEAWWWYWWRVFLYCLVYTGAAFLLWVALIIAMTLPWDGLLTADYAWCSRFAWIVVGAIFVFTTYVYWRQDGDVRAGRGQAGARQFASPHIGPEGYNPEITFIFGLVIYLSFAGLLLLKNDATQYWAYVRYILSVMASSLPFGESIKEWVRSDLDLGNTPLNTLVGAAYASLFDWIWRALALVVTLTLGYTGFALYGSERRKTLETRLLWWIRASARDERRTVERVEHLVRRAVEGGDADSYAAVRATDKIIAGSCGDKCEPEGPVSNFVLFKATFAAYLVAAWKCVAVERSVLLERLLRMVTREVESTFLYWPAIRAHRAVTSEARAEDNIKGLVEYMRRSVTEWDATRAPMHWAAANEALGALLTELAADERETYYLEEAVEVCTQGVEIWRQNKNLFGDADLSAALHNLGVAELLLGRRRCKPAFVGKAIEHFTEALVLRSPKPDQIPLGGGVPLLPAKVSPADVAASHTMRGQAYATSAIWYGEDKDISQAIVDYNEAIEQYKDAAKNNNEIAHFNAGVVNLYAGNLLLQSGSPAAAVKHYMYAHSVLSRSVYQADKPKERGAPKYHAQLRVALGSLHAAAAALSRLNQPVLATCADAPPDLRERAREYVQRANNALAEMAGKRKDIASIVPWMHWVKGAAWIVEAELCFSGALPTKDGQNLAGCRAIRGAVRVERGAYLTTGKDKKDKESSWWDRANNPNWEKEREKKADGKLKDQFKPEIEDCSSCTEDPAEKKDK